MNLYDMLLAQKLGGGGSTPSVDIETLSVTANGEYIAPSGKAYSPVNVLVPNSYSAGDEGKVVSNGALVAQSSQNIDTNGTYDTTLKDEIVVNVSGGGGGGATNVAYGTITPTEAGELTVDTGYSGTGYPIGIIISDSMGWRNISDTKNNNILNCAIFKEKADESTSVSTTFKGVVYWSDYGSNKMSTKGSVLPIKSTFDSSVGLCMPDNTHLKLNIVASGATGAGYILGRTLNYCIIYSS